MAKIVNLVESFFHHWLDIKWNKVFKNGLSKICGRQPLRNSFSPLLNPLPQIFDRLNQSSIGLSTLRKKFPNTEFFLVRIFPYSGWIRRFTSLISRPYPFKFFRGCLPQILLGRLLNNLSQMHFCWF